MKYSIKQVFILELHCELLRLDVWVWAFFLTFLMKFGVSTQLWNQGEFMIKELNKAIMTRSRLPNKYLKEKNTDSKITNKKQRN